MPKEMTRSTTSSSLRPTVALRRCHWLVCNTRSREFSLCMQLQLYITLVCHFGLYFYQASQKHSSVMHSVITVVSSFWSPLGTNYRLLTLLPTSLTGCKSFSRQYGVLSGNRVSRETPRQEFGTGSIPLGICFLVCQHIGSENSTCEPNVFGRKKKKVPCNVLHCALISPQFQCSWTFLQHIACFHCDLCAAVCSR
ncbi:hypothetical protein B0H16DRAFT_977641 [Mycena metata]|uniref:Uncharacterized protein n=1 Tax=Mycena metata TaxID=1033252 RepID=A0AAD7MG91_9AGAR|nr:hypothetical protein B0H16DRAFT_495624 [Mycena metata]KAJ7745341.1 hypothetical protein B0H16DRAFT_977641 [Mycena metata]